MIGRRFSMDDLGEAFGTELTDALEIGRRLEAALDRVGVSLPGVETGFDAATEASGGLGDRVMAALENEPAPATTGFLLPLRRRGVIHGLATSVRQAWVALGGSGRPILARGAALAYVLVIALAGVSITGAATAGALGILGPAPTTSPPPTLPAPTLAPAQPTQQVPSTVVPPSVVPPSVAPSPTPSPSPSESPEESDDNGGNSGPGGGGDDNSGPGSSDDNGGNSGPGGGDDNSGPGGGSGSGGGDDNSGPGGTGSGSGSGSGSDSSGPGSGR